MKLYILILSIISTSYSAPASQYLVYTPAATQFIKYRPQISSELRLQDGKQALYYYPTTSFTPFTHSLSSPFFTTNNRYQIIALKDEGQGGQGGFDWNGFFQNWFGTGGSGESGATGTESGATPESQSPESSRTFTQRFDLEKEMQKMTPEKKEEFNKKYYIITQPYYNNFAPFAPVLSLSPLEISERSKEIPVLAEKDFKVDIIPTIKIIQARSIMEEKKEDMAAPIMEEKKEMLNEEFKKEKLEVKEEMKKEFMEEEKKEEMLMEKKKDMSDAPKKEELLEEKKESRDGFEKEEKLPEPMVKEEIKIEPAKAELKEGMKDEPMPMGKVLEDPSVAQAQPQAVAVAAEGGLAAAAPISTAIVGEGGVATVAARATAVSGSFEDEKKSDPQ